MRIGVFTVFLISMKFFFSFQLAVYKIEKIGKNSDAVIKIFNDEDSVIAVSINGEIQICKKKS